MGELCALVVGLAVGAVGVSQWEIDRRAMPRWERWGWTVLVGVGFAAVVALARRWGRG